MDALTVRSWEREYARRGRLWGGTRLDPHTLRVLDEDASLQGAFWLDAGCGDGKGLVPLVSRLDPSAPAVVALDASRAGLRHAAAGLHATHGVEGRRRVRFVQGDVLRLPFMEQGFDVVRAVHLVGHLHSGDRERAVGEMRRVLRPGGMLVLGEFGTGDFRAGKGMEVEPGTYRRGTGIETHYFSRGELESLFPAAHWDRVRLHLEGYEVEYAGTAYPRQRWELTATAR